MVNKRIVLYLCFEIVLWSCSLRVEEDYRFKFGGLDGDQETFLFFTDPHMDPSDKVFKSYLSDMKKGYDRSSADFCLCGGDWLNDKDTREQAINKLKHIDLYLYSLWGKEYYVMLGNHDTNYQGKYDKYSENNTGKLEQDLIVNACFYRYGNAYYSFYSKSTLYVILDTGIDWQGEMTEYRINQVEWLANILIHNNSKHIILGFHIFSNKLPWPEAFADNILCLGEAFNNRDIINLFGNSYDFSKSQGCIACCICGHYHMDFVNYDHEIPVVGTKSFKSGESPTYDLCLLDWDNNKMNMIRFGNGENRVIELSHN